MRRRNQISPEEARAIAKEEQEKREKFISNGMCVYCEEYPINPQLNEPCCLECAQELEWSCTKGDCFQTGEVFIYQGHYCKVHAVDSAHQLYEDWMKKKDELEKVKKQIDQLSDKIDGDPEDIGSPDGERGEKYEELMNLKVQKHHLKMDIGEMKKAIDRVMESVDEVFPGGHEMNI